MAARAGAESARMRVLVTGGAGFVGHHLIEHLLLHTDWEIVTLDRLDTSGNLNRLAEMLKDGGEAEWSKRVTFRWHDLRAPINSLLANQLGNFDYVLHLAALTHVNRSIADPMAAVQDNVVATCNLLDWARLEQAGHLRRYLFFSSDAFYGPAPDNYDFKETDRYQAGNPYAATKAGAEQLALAYGNTYEVPVTITNCMNIFGERQHPEKFIPMTIKKLMAGETIRIHGNGHGEPGRRYWIHARNVAAAVLYLLRYPEQWMLDNQSFNVVGEREISNLEMAELIARYAECPITWEIVDANEERPGHDFRYGLSGAKLAALGWTPPVDIEHGLRKTVTWTIEHAQDWL